MVRTTRRLVSISVSVEQEQLVMIDNYAVERGLTTSQAVRELLDKGRAHELLEQARRQQQLEIAENDSNTENATQ